jgi:O-antigen biosynthesis protein
MKLCFLVGSMAISGGTYVIVQHASYLRDQGFDVTLAVQEPFTPATLAWHDQAPTLRCVPFEDAKSEHFDLVIATWWKTALEIGNFNADRHAYFVQSIESRFYPADEVPLRALVDSTYHLPVNYVTEASWIRSHLTEHFGHAAALVRNGIRKDVYQPSGPTVATRENGQPRVLVEGHFGVSFKNTALAIRLAREAGAKDIWLLTGSPVSWVPKVSRVFSRVPMVSTPDIYRSCDILVKLSTVEGMFGPPLEIFHCGGTAVVFDVTGHDEYIVDGLNARVVARNDADRVVEAIRELLRDADRLQRLKDGALQTAADWPSWGQSSAQFQTWVQACLEGPAVDRTILAEMAAKAWSDYARDEQARLHRNPGIVRRHKLSAIASRMPASVVRRVKQMEAAGEVMFGGRKAF